ncbi:MAG TPA: DoxX family membrane protein [Candidatus Paceibacterota bacterium]
MERKQKIALHILRVGLAITFIGIGIYILKDPVGWSGFIKPWARDLLPTSPEQVMITTGWGDIVIGVLLLLSRWKIVAFIGALLATLHMIVVLVTSGINAVTIRDVAILAAAASVMFIYWPTRRKSLAETQIPNDIQRPRI